MLESSTVLRRKTLDEECKEEERETTKGNAAMRRE